MDVKECATACHSERIKSTIDSDKRHEQKLSSNNDGHGGAGHDAGLVPTSSPPSVRCRLVTVTEKIDCLSKQCTTIAVKIKHIYCN